MDRTFIFPAQDGDNLLILKAENFHEIRQRTAAV
jgi:hypothetical protein